MRYAGQHLRAFADLPLNAFLHLDKGNSRTANLYRAVRLKVLIVNSFTEIFGHSGQFGNRPYLNPQKQRRHQKQQQRRTYHPGNKTEYRSRENVFGRRRKLKQAVFRVNENHHVVITLAHVNAADGLRKFTAQRIFQKPGHQLAVAAGLV